MRAEILLGRFERGRVAREGGAQPPHATQFFPGSIWMDFWGVTCGCEQVAISQREERTKTRKKEVVTVWCGGVATISRLLKIIDLFCRISSLFKGSFAKETYKFKEPTNRSQPIVSSL